MVTEELIIDGQAVDMDSSTAVTLNFVSNLLGDIDAIETSRSQTISLPKTAHNRAVLDDPASPSHDSAARYVRHTAKYRRNGVEVIPDGYAVLLRCADAYEVAVYWGIIAKLQSWLDAGPTLSDLGWEPSEGDVTWVKTNNTGEIYLRLPLDGFFWANYDCGVGDYEALLKSELQVALHPFVQAWTLLKRIGDNIGISQWNIPDAVQSDLYRTAVLLPTNHAESESQSGTLTYGTMTEDTYTRQTTFSCVVSGLTSCESFTVTQGANTTFITFNRPGRVTCTVYVTLRFSNQNEAMTYAERSWLSLAGAGQMYGAYLEESGNWYALFSGTVSGTPSSGQVGIIAQVFVPAAGLSFPNQPVWGGGFGMTFVPDSDDAAELGLGNVFPASPNMPDLTQLEFFKGVCAMHGMFVMPYGADGLQVCTLESLTGNRANAVDWSDRLVASDTPCEPGETAFSWGDWARHNWFRYKEDDTVGADGDGDLQVANASLDYERDVTTLPFAPSDSHKFSNYAGGGVGVTIPHYELEEDEDEEGEATQTVKRKEVKPRVVWLDRTLSGTHTIAAFSWDGTNPGIRWPDLLESWYGALSALLNSCVAVTEEFRLTEHDLLNLDYLKPIYLRQYGRYYGIVSIQTQDDGTCKAELLQLPLE